MRAPPFSATALAALLAAAALAACGGGAPAPRSAAIAADPSPVACPVAGAHEVPGGRLVIPAGARAGSMPLLVVVIPGGRGDPGDRLGLAHAATRAGIALVYPEQSGGFWSLNHAQGDADVTAVDALLRRTLALPCVDARRVSVTGVSNGAGFATRLACALPDRFAAVVPVAAGFRALDPCPARTGTSLLAIHGSADTVVPYNGRRPGRAGSVPRFAARWAHSAGCAAGRTTHPRARVTRIAYGGCRDGLHVGILRLSGTDHGWPGAGPPLPDHNPSGLHATDEVLRFVRGAGRS